MQLSPQAAVEVFWSAPDLKVETGITIAQAAGNQDAAFSPARSLTSSALPANLELTEQAHDKHRADDGSIDATVDSVSSASLSALLAAENSGMTAVGITGVDVALPACGSGAAAAEGAGSGDAEMHVTFKPLVDLPVTLIAGLSCVGSDGTCATEVVLYDLTIGGNACTSTRWRATASRCCKRASQANTPTAERSASAWPSAT
jgi:purine-nucleoside phosphorylase